jgi:hypothetical protein
MSLPKLIQFGFCRYIIYSIPTRDQAPIHPKIYCQLLLTFLADFR